MLYNQTKIKVTDNSGSKIACCLHIYKQKVGFIGSIVLVSIKTIKAQTKIKKGAMHKAIIVRTKRKKLRYNGNCLFFANNVVVLLNKKNELLGSRIFGPVGKELRKKNLLKILSLSNLII